MLPGSSELVYGDCCQRTEMLDKTPPILTGSRRTSNMAASKKTMEQAPDWNLSRDRFWQRRSVWKGMTAEGNELVKVIAAYAS